MSNWMNFFKEVSKLDINLTIKIDEKQFRILNQQINAIRKLTEKYGKITEDYAERVLKEATKKSDTIIKKVDDFKPK